MLNRFRTNNAIAKNWYGHGCTGHTCASGHDTEAREISWLDQTRSGIEHPQIQNVFLNLPLQEPSMCSNIQASIMHCLWYSWTAGHVVSLYRVQVMLYWHSMTHFWQQRGSDISHLIVSYRGKSSSWTWQSVLNSEAITTGAMRRWILKCPIIAKKKSISECGIMERKLMFVNGQCRQPGWSPFLLRKIHILHSTEAGSCLHRDLAFFFFWLACWVSTRVHDMLDFMTPHN